MKKNYFAILVYCCCAVSIYAQQQPARFGWIENAEIRRESGVATVSCNHPDAMSDVISAVRLEYGWTVSVEAPPFFSDFDLIDDTPPKWKATHPSGRVRRARVGKFTSSYTEYPDMSQAPAQESVLKKIIADYNASENAGKYELLRLGDGSYDVVPSSVTDSDDLEKRVQPILDTIISIPEQERSVFETIETIFDALTTKTGKKIILFTPSSNDLMKRATIGGESVSARSLVTRALAATSRPMLWELGYNPNKEIYLFSPSVVMMAQQTETGQSVPVAIDRIKARSRQ